jgi:large subunit ribosomal protein L32
MALPNKRHTKSRQRTRRATHKISPVTVLSCPQCKKPVRPHHACAFCGTYQNKTVIKIKLPKALRKKKVKTEKKAEKETKKDHTKKENKK